MSSLAAPPVASQLPQPSSSILAGWPGRSAASQQAAHELLLRNHTNHHIYTSNNIFHNHLSHHILTAFSLGAPSSLLRKIFNEEAAELVPLDPVERQKELAKTGKKTRTDIPAIDEGNWREYLGVQDAYASYLTFFERQLREHGTQETLVRHLFSPEANAGGETNSKGPRMLIRLVAGVVHPFIHVGFGAEFSYDLMIAEGLAMIAVHSPDAIGPLFPSSWPHTAPDALVTGLGAPKVQEGENLSALEAYRLCCESEGVVIRPYDPEKMINTRLKEAWQNGNAAEMQRLTILWCASAPPTEDGASNTTKADVWLARKVDEVQVLAAFLTCATGKLGRETRIDFFLMHLLTSSLFLPSILPLLPSFDYRLVLLKTYFLTLLETALSRGRPSIDARIPLSWPLARPPPASAASKQDAFSGEKNGWLEAVGAGLVHPDSHVPKALRSLVHLSTTHGLACAGELPGAQGKEGKEVFPGLGQADGSVFQRMAVGLVGYMGWSHAEGEGKGWDRTALGWEGAWAKDARS